MSQYPKVQFDDLPSHVRGHITDMSKNAAFVGDVVDDVLKDTEGPITDEQMEEILRRSAPHKKLFTEYDW